MVVPMDFSVYQRHPVNHDAKINATTNAMDYDVVGEMDNLVLSDLDDSYSPKVTANYGATLVQQICEGGSENVKIHEQKP